MNSQDLDSPAPTGHSHPPVVSQPTTPTDHNTGTSDSRVGQPEYHVSKDDIIIAVMGPTGVGKSSFINIAMGQGAAVAGHSLKSCTREVLPFRYRHPGGGESNIVFVDTPGFDDTEIKEADILASIAQWLKQTYEQGITLSGVLYLHRISDNRMAGTPLSNWKVFKELCGEECFQSVLLATTMWDDVTEECGSQRQEQLKRKYWKSMIKLGSRVVRFHNTYQSAWDIIGQLTAPRKPLKIQKEMVEEQKPLSETSAGRVLYSWLSNFIVRIRKFIESIGVRTSSVSGTSVSEEKRRLDAIRQLKQAEGQLEALCGPTGLESVPKQALRPSTPSIQFDARSLSHHDLHRLSDSRSSSSSSLLDPIPHRDVESLPLEFCNRRLAATITALRVARDVACISPVPGLEGATSLALTVAESVAAMKKTQNALVTVAHNTGRLVVALSEHGRAGHMPDHIQHTVNDLTRELKTIQKVVNSVKLRSRWQAQRFLLQPAEEQLVIQCNERIQFAIQMFEIKFALDIRQVLARVEARICQLDP